MLSSLVTINYLVVLHFIFFFPITSVTCHRIRQLSNNPVYHSLQWNRLFKHDFIQFSFLSLKCFLSSWLLLHCHRVSLYSITEFGIGMYVQKSFDSIKQDRRSAIFKKHLWVNDFINTLPSQCYIIAKMFLWFFSIQTKFIFRHYTFLYNHTYFLVRTHSFCYFNIHLLLRLQHLFKQNKLNIRIHISEPYWLKFIYLLLYNIFQYGRCIPNTDTFSPSLFDRNKIQNLFLNLI